MARRKESATVTEEPPVNHEAAEEKAQPIHKVRLRNVTGAIWQNARQDGTAYYTFTVSRSYRDDQNNWHSTGSFAAVDGFLLAEVSRLCALHIIGLTQNQDVPF